MTWHQHPLTRWLAGGAALYGLHYLTSGNDPRAAARRTLNETLGALDLQDPMARLVRDRAQAALVEEQARLLQQQHAHHSPPWHPPLTREQALQILADRQQAARMAQGLGSGAEPVIRDAEFEILEDEP